uniref:Uncharacterized protein n=1 Tax=Avena sativa TaxID=4498 RepID=A0ACD5Z4K7_AVESA
MEGEKGEVASCSVAAGMQQQQKRQQQVRVVRCPKCENFLPELPNYSVYVCGGCGTTLQANKNSASETSLDKSDVVHVKYLEVLESLPEKKGPVPEANFGTVPEENSERVQATAEERSVPQRTASEHRDSRCSSDGNQIPRETSALKFEATLRADDSREIREAKYRRIRNEDKGEAKQPVILRDRSPRSVVDTIPPNAYPGEHPSEYPMKSRFRDANGVEHADMRNVDGPNSVSGFKKDRNELLRVLDELRDQVQRSCEITEKPSGSASTNRVADASSSCGPHERLSRLRHGSPQLQRDTSQHSPSLNGQVPGIPHAYASVPTQPDLHGYMGAPCYPVGQYPWRNCDNYFFGQYNHDPLVSYHHDGFYHQPACSCLHCYHREFLTVQGASMGFNHRRAPYLMNNPRVYPVDGSVMFGMQNNNSRGINASLQRSHMRANLSKKPAQKCEPIACGAPFTICYNCYEVLQLPKKSPLPGKAEYKLRCGSCSHAIVVKLDGNRLDVSAPSPISHMSTASKVNSSDVQTSNADTAIGERLFPLYSFSAGSHGSQERDLHSNSSDAEKVQGASSSSSIFEDENSPAGSNSQRDTPGSRNLPLEAQVVTRVPSLPLRDHFGYSPSERVVDGSGKGSRSTRSEHEKSVLTESFKHNTIKDVRVVSVMDLSDDEYEDPDYSQNPGNGAQHVDRPTVSKSGDSFFTNLIKKSFKGNGRSKVFINGYPISDRAVRKAEKIAGPIYPGEYWYDYRAGFWGVMGQSCLGMIPPYIPELNYPMPKNCAGGNTGVFINGRELHQKDFDLLVERGLSESPDRSYKIEMCGKVYDEVSGEELYCLGKLAPTVEKMKRGFGMRPPRIIH